MKSEYRYMDPIIAHLLPGRVKGREYDFLKRIYGGGLARYEKRLEALGLAGADRVLDAGSGYGQWSIALSRLNRSVCSLELNELRCEVSTHIFHGGNHNNIDMVNGSIINLPFKNNSFDTVFSYSAIYQVDWRDALREYFRVLKRGGKLYFSVNGLGWSIYNIIKNQNPSYDFSPRRNALKSMAKLVSCGGLFPDSDWILFKKQTREVLRTLNFSNIIIDGDGCINVAEAVEVTPFYESTYCGLTNVFEVLATKA